MKEIVVDLNKKSDKEAVELALMMFEEHFPETLRLLIKKDYSDLQELKEELFTIDKKIIEKETSFAMAIFRKTSTPEDLEEFGANLDTVQGVFNTYKAASWIITASKVKFAKMVSSVWL